MGPMTLRDIMMTLRKYNHLGTREWYVDTSGGVVYSNVVQVKIGRTEGDEIARKYHASGEPAVSAESGDKRVFLGEKEFNAAMAAVQAFDEVPPEAHEWLIDYVKGRRNERERAAKGGAGDE